MLFRSWTNWQEYVEETSQRSSPSEELSSNKKLSCEQQDKGKKVTDTTSNKNSALWKTFDPMLGDPELVTVEAKVPASMGAGILECAYALDQDGNVIGFAYGTKPSDAILMDDEASEEKPNGSENNLDDEGEKKKEEGTKDKEGDAAVDNNEVVSLNIRLVSSRTEQLILAASYTCRNIIDEKKNNSDDNNSIGKKAESMIESHLYKSRPFVLNEISKRRTQSRNFAKTPVSIQ